jgi:hypothetical protein
MRNRRDADAEVRDDLPGCPLVRTERVAGSAPHDALPQLVPIRIQGT